MIKHKKHIVTIAVTKEQLDAFLYVVLRANEADYDWKKSDPENPETDKALKQVDKADELFRRLFAAVSKEGRQFPQSQVTVDSALGILTGAGSITDESTGCLGHLDLTALQVLIKDHERLSKRLSKRRTK